MPQPKRSSTKGSTTPVEDDAKSTLDAVRELLARSLMLPSDRLRETLDDAVKRGRITRDDAEELIDRLVALGRAQTDDTLARLERIVSPGRTAARGARSAVRRAVGAGGQTFPISGYDDLTAAQVIDRLGELTAADLRRVADYERKNANRKSVLAAIDKNLR